MLRAGAEGRRILRELEMPVPFDLSRFTAGLERLRRRPIRLHPVSFGPGGPCGRWIAAEDADHIYHEAGTTRFHATHMTLHEMAHMLLDRDHTAARDQFARLLAPDVRETLIRPMPGRSAYSTAEKRGDSPIPIRLMA